MAETPPERSGSEAEKLLLDRARSGDEAACQALLLPHLPSLLALARRRCSDRHWAEDLLQEALVRAFRALPSFRGEASLRTWLFQILVNLAAEPRRWRKGGPPAVAAPGVIPDQLAMSAIDTAIGRELEQRLEEAMERLPERQRLALHFRAAEGLDYAAIGLVLACSPAAARTLVWEARRKVMERLDGYLDP